LKLNAKTGLIVIAVIATGMFINLWMDRNQQAEKLEQLQNDLSLAVLRFNTLQNEEIVARHTDIQNQLSQTVAEVEAAKAELSQSDGSISASGTLFDTAEAAGVEITEITSSQPSSETIEGIAYAALVLNVTVEGDVADIISFVGRLKNEFPAGLVKSVDVSISNPAVPAETSAIIKLHIYSFEGE